MWKRFLVLVLALGFLFSSGVAYAAQATVTKVDDTYYITGGTDETLVYAGGMRCRTIAYCAATAANVATFNSGAVSGVKWYMKSAGVSGVNQCYINFGDQGAVFYYLSVKLSEVTDVVIIYN